MKRLIVLLVAQIGGAFGSPVMELWTLDTHSENPFELVSQERTRPMIEGDILFYANNKGDVVAIHRALGFVLWKVNVGSSVNGSLKYGRSKLYVGDSSGYLTALHSRDGSVAWKIKIQSEWLSPVAVQRDKVCASTSAEELYCLNERDGKELWHYSHRGDEKMTIRGTGSPTIYGDVIYQGFADGHLSALSLETGSVIWTKKLKTRSRFYDIDMPLFVDDKGVLVGTFDGNLYYLDRNDGSTIWMFAVGSASGFLVEAERIYFSGLNGFFYAMDRTSGSPIWKTAFDSGVGLTPARVGDLIVFSTTKDPIYAVKDSTGEVVWTKSLGSGTFSGVVSNPVEGSFYVLSNYGNLFAFEVIKPPLCVKHTDIIQSPSAFWPHTPEIACRV